MNFLKDLFNIKEDAQPVDAITSGKELRERQEDLQTGVGSVTEELMKQNPELFNNVNAGGGGGGDGGKGIMDLVNQGSLFLQKPIIADKFSIGDALTLRGALSGNPLSMFGLGMMALRNLPKETPEQKTVKGLYDLDNTGRIQSGLMAGYNPVSLFGSTGLSGAMIDRITNIDKTLNNKVISNKTRQVLEDRKRALEEAIAREQAAVKQTIEQQYRDRPGEYGGANRQIEREQAGPGYTGSGTAAEMGSFRYGGIASL